jgi:hypothetical protein
MHLRKLAALIAVATVGPLGCRVDHPPTRKQVAEERAEDNAEHTAPAAQRIPLYNDAARVIEACGQPLSDTTVAIFDKLYNGPVRRMTYRGRQIIIVEFVPANPEAHQTDIPAPFPQPERGPTSVSPDTVWRFQTAHMQNREYLTSKHLDIYLPCAAGALRDEL